MEKEKIGERIKHIRNSKGISQEKLALSSGLDRTYINSVENGKRNITIDTLSKITTSLDVSLKDFFDTNYKFDYNPSDTVFLICCDKINYERTMVQGVDINELKSIFTFNDFNKIKELSIDDIVYIWGTSESNSKIYNLLEIGNVAIFSNSGKTLSCSKLLCKIKNSDFGEKYWPNNKDKKWPYLLIMDKPTSLEIPVSTLMLEAGYKKKFIQGLNIPRGEHNILIKNYIDKIIGK